MESHHIVAVKDGGEDSTVNLVHLHKVCQNSSPAKPIGSSGIPLLALK
ncbi:hypothetical protein Cyast_2855 [Cyanobacterium stanieri PCC 7202]|uniref:HNH domain-containing protein n=1 Tax=Cyanobacterium stanieri (strain ATCC 29140 / PCC 7202) TaxID=292563 RepID=K9YR02_CYASC|nr:hypothetical protein Cyast_2855 [Cyanobacterium stanieri PCC 7202]